eukprot:14043683-Alexandrium_andersonii.AAC.1
MQERQDELQFARGPSARGICFPAHSKRPFRAESLPAHSNEVNAPSRIASNAFEANAPSRTASSSNALE